MRLSVFFKSLFGSAKEKATDLSSKASESFNETKDKAKPYLKKVEYFAEETIEKAKETAAPYLEKAESFTEETYAKAKETTAPYLEKTKIFTEDAVQTITEIAAPIVEKIHIAGNHTKDTVYEYAGKAEALFESLKDDFTDKTKEISVQIDNVSVEDKIIIAGTVTDIDEIPVKAVATTQEFTIDATTTINATKEELEQKIKDTVKESKAQVISVEATSYKELDSLTETTTAIKNMGEKPN